ncbi:MAG TPA: MBL fold metallo-hydrolase [Burkholderiales bacterium]|nr:MBL fold metallo-hydrolase [Burkholderiales bacterium]
MPPVRITLLGTGAALVDPDRGHSGIALTVGGQHYLLDIGHGTTRQLVRAHIDPAEINHVFISHLHFDHIEDAGYFVISTWMMNRTTKPVIHGPPGTRSFIGHLLEDGAFQADIRARAAYRQRAESIEMVRPEVREFGPGLIFDDGVVKVHADYVEHIAPELLHCFGFRIEAAGKVIAFSGDTAPCEAMARLARGADVLIHECTFPEEALEFRKKVQIGTYAHTSPTELGKLATRAGVKSLVATHFGHFDTTSPILKKSLAKHMPIELVGPAFMESVVRDIRKHYSGPLAIANDLMRIDL